MLLNIIFAILFVGGGILLWHRITEKIPQLVAISDDTIASRLEEDSAKLRIILLHFKRFWRERYFHDLFFNFLIKILRRLHIAILRVDNGLVGVLKKIQSRDNGLKSEEMANAEYWKELKQASLTDSSMPREVREVRTNAKKRLPPSLPI